MKSDAEIWVERCKDTSFESVFSVKPANNKNVKPIPTPTIEKKDNIGLEEMRRYNKQNNQRERQMEQNNREILKLKKTIQYHENLIHELNSKYESLLNELNRK